MSGETQTLLPGAGESGLASSDTGELATLVSDAWDGMISLARRLPLDAPSRLEGWSIRDVLVHLGSWDENPVFASLIDDARHDRVHEVDDAEARNAMVVAAHNDADCADLVAALEAARDRAVTFLTSDEGESVGRCWTDSAVGPLPVNAAIAASAYELAVHALDIAPPADVPAPLLDAGVGALVDLAGALAARHGITTTFAVITPVGSWASGSAEDSWLTLHLNGDSMAHRFGWPSVAGMAHDVLDASAGRALVPQLLLTRRLRLHDLPGLLRLLPALDAVPGLPGGSALRTAARALSQTGRLVSSLGRHVTWR